jgi:hypothetical protein
MEPRSAKYIQMWWPKHVDIIKPSSTVSNIMNSSKVLTSLIPTCRVSLDSSREDALHIPAGYLQPLATLRCADDGKLKRTIAAPLALSILVHSE